MECLSSDRGGTAQAMTTKKLLEASSRYDVVGENYGISACGGEEALEDVVRWNGMK